MDRPAFLTPDSIKLLGNQLYEYKKGVRRLFLMTISTSDREQALRRLEQAAVSHWVQEVNASKVNVYFGHPAWVETVRSVIAKPLNRLSPEEDFMLGTLLGYDGEQQCRRYLARSRKATVAA